MKWSFKGEKVATSNTLSSTEVLYVVISIAFNASVSDKVVDVTPLSCLRKYT